MDWASLFPQRHVVADLPTYPFQHERYWLVADDAVGRTGHGWLEARVPTPDGVVASGSIGLRRMPWLADHSVSGTVLLPGTVLLEAVLTAAGWAGLPVIEELTLLAPIIVTDEPVTVQITIEDTTVTVRCERDGQWSDHATGTLTATGRGAAPVVDRPATADPLDTGDFYETLSARGYDYGPAFQGLQRLWQHDGDHYAEIAVDGLNSDGYLLHPALLDAAIQPLAAASDQVALPFSLHDVTLHGPGEAARTHVTADRRVTVASAEGMPLLTIGRIVLRPAVLPTEIPLLALRWQAAEAVHGPVLSTTVLRCPRPDVEDPAAAVHEVVGAVHDACRRWLATEPADDERLVVVTERAVVVDGIEDVDLVQAPVWGLVRSAQVEHPDRFVLLDVDVFDDGLVQEAVGRGSQVAVRDGSWWAPVTVAVSPAAVVLPDGDWLVDVVGEGGSFDAVAAVASGAGRVPLAPGEVRVEIRAAGLNLRDVVLTLGMVDQVGIGSEGAGVVVESASDAFRPGDRVLGLFGGAFGS
ncbi:polyketide synthase dehydratase domain-containing protein, partial [Micromonospora sp. CPCC 205546]|uniref:polyketide synthase dehydratase domain-containing protein n=1 Tax=Micromonospora sp. CPCC 205546 TaxID=3122397 RepID=UPI002FF3DE3C